MIGGLFLCVFAIVSTKCLSFIAENRDSIGVDMPFYKTEKTALLVDSISCYLTSQKLGFEIDYLRLYNSFADQFHLVSANYFVVLVEEMSGAVTLQPLCDFLEFHGWRLHKLKIAEEKTNNLLKTKTVCIMLAAATPEMLSSVDHFVLFSGDGDFVFLVRALQRLGKRVTVVSSIKNGVCAISDELRKASDNFIDLGEIREAICKQAK